MSIIITYIVIYILQCIATLLLNYYILDKDASLWDFITFKDFESKIGFPSWLFAFPIIGSIICALGFVIMLLCIFDEYFKKLKFILKNKLQTIKIK